VMMQRHPHGRDLATTAVDKTEERGDHEPTPAPHLTGEEVRRQQDIEVATDELVPGGGLPTLWRWWNAMMLEYIPHALVAERVSPVGQSSHDAVIAPGAVLAGHPNHQVFDLLVDARTANWLMEMRPVTLLARKRAVPSQDSIGLGNHRHLSQGLFAQLLAKPGECFAITVREVHTTVDVLAEQAILGDQVRIAKPELFVNRLGDRSQQFLPVHTSITPAKTSSMDDQYGRKRSEIQAETELMAEAQLLVEQRVWIF
jgi:hypothetical protein